MGLLTGDLPDFPWDTLTPFAERARAYPGGIVDLSVGTPVDPTPELVREFTSRTFRSRSFRESPPASARPPMREFQSRIRMPAMS